MTMSRESMRAQMQSQRPTRKRQLSDVAPSPPKKWTRFVAANSPVSSPNKGPLVEMDDDETPSFRAKSFYGKKRVIASPLFTASSKIDDDETPSFRAKSFYGKTKVTPSPLVSASSDELTMSPTTVTSGKKGSDVVTRRNTRHASSRRSKDDTEVILNLKPSRVALSPIKNVVHNLKPKPEAKARKRSQSLPGRVKPAKKVASFSQPPQRDEADEAVTISTPDNTRKFFKHKSPGSASKSVGGIVIGKGFNLKFVRGLLNRDFDKQPGKKTASAGAATVKRRGHQGKKALKTYTRKATKPQEQGRSSGSSSLVSEPFSQDGDDSASDQSSSLPLPGLSPDSSSVHSKMSDEISESPSLFTDEISESQSLYSADAQSLSSEMSGPVISPVQPQDSHKLYSIFSNGRRSRRLADPNGGPGQKRAADSPVTPPLRKFIGAKGDKKQLTLDAGQEQFGATQCRVCGMVYTPVDAADRTTHAKFHQSAIAALKFQGWKKERLIKDFLDDGSRVIAILPGDSSFMGKKVEEVNRVMGQELGFPDHVFSFHGNIKAFLYISDEKRVEGCCIAETIAEGFPILPNSSQDAGGESQRPWFSSSVPKPAAVGIGRLWVYGPSRQSGIATRLLDCVRQWFEYGIIIDKRQVAFSDPTPDGRRFAAKYTGTPTFLVYKYQH